MVSLSNPAVSASSGQDRMGVARAYLRFVGVPFRIFGDPMRRWLSQMPQEMLLKSESSYASSLTNRTGQHTLSDIAKKNVLFPKYGTPVPRSLFAQYGLYFQKTLVPGVETVSVTEVEISHKGFELQLSSGETFAAGTVVVATGLEHMDYIPEELAHLPIELRSHTSGYYDLSGFKNKDVTVIGAGQSGLETAALL